MTKSGLLSICSTYVVIKTMIYDVGLQKKEYFARYPYLKNHVSHKGLTVNVDSLYSTYLVIQFMMSYDDSTYLVIEIMTYDV